MNAIICHGTMGSPQGNWFPWISEQLGLLGIHTYVPKFPTPHGQSLQSWLAAIDEQCPPVTPETILIGHSSGALLCLRLLEQLPSSVRCTVLVAPPLEDIGIVDIDILNASFYSDPFDWQSIQRNAGELLYFMGDDDQYVPQSQLLEVARLLDVKPFVVPKGGHLNSETGFVTFPMLFDSLQPLLRDAG